MFLGRLMALKGIMARVKPMATADEKSTTEYNRTLNMIPNSGMRTFLLAGSPDIRDEKGAQSFLDGYLNGLERFRSFLKANKDMELTLNMNDWTAYGVFNNNSHADDYCTTTQVTPGVYESKDCDYTHALEVKLNRADIESMQQIVAGEEIYFIAATAYSATGSISTAKKFENRTERSSVVWNELSKYPEFATLRNQNLKRIVSMGIDAVPAVRWAIQEQKQLCPAGISTPSNRKGYLFSQGICIEDKQSNGPSTSEVLKTVELALAGQAIAVKVGSQGEINSMAAPAAPLLNPVQDLKVLRPVYNTCDSIVSVSDDTIAGVFPNHDGNSILASSQCHPNGI